MFDPVLVHYETVRLMFHSEISLLMVDLCLFQKPVFVCLAYFIKYHLVFNTLLLAPNSLITFWIHTHLNLMSASWATLSSWRDSIHLNLQLISYTETVISINL